MPVSSDGKMRFPRLKPFANTKLAKAEAKRLGLSRTQTFEMRTATGNLPKGYDRVNKKQKKVAKMVARGISIKDACKVAGTLVQTFYRWRRASPVFRNYLAMVSLRYAQRVDEQLEGKLPRAVQVVEDSLNSGDPYFEYDAAKDLLKGRGKYKSSVQSQQQITGGLNITGKHDIHSHGLNKDMMLMFVNALVGKAQEVRAIKTIDVKALPESIDGNPEVQAEEEREAV